jgi:hypothetical protein
VRTLEAPALLQTVQEKWNTLRPHLDEKTRRLWAATEIRAIGRGGLKLVHQATGLSQTTLRRALQQQASQQSGQTQPLPPGRVRRPGGGRKRQIDTNPTLLTDLQSLVDPVTRGDPESPLRWSSKSAAKLAIELRAKGHGISGELVRQLLHQLGYSLQANRKTKEGASHPDRDAQFAYLNGRTRAMQQAGQPVISVDCKKKELVGAFKNGGREWHPKGEPEQVQVHDFLDKELGKAIPYGVYDVTQNQGFVNVGVDHDTAAFAVATIARWWEQIGQKMYPHATELQIMADGGGSNSSRCRLWKASLQQFADATGLQVHVSHLPPGTSKWNKIEHRMFSFISLNWRGRPLVSHEVIVSLIGSTTTQTGLRIEAALDPRPYPTKIRVSDADLARVNVEEHAFHGEWNYTIRPRK